MISSLRIGGKFSMPARAMAWIDATPVSVSVNAGPGEFDGDEFGGGECTLYMYGPDADRLFGAVEEELRSSEHAGGGFAVKRYGAAGDPSAREIRVDL